MVDGSGNVLEYLDGALHNVKELMGSSEDLDGDVLLKDLNYGLLVVNDVAATPIICQKEPGSVVSCTVGGKCNFNVCLLCVLHKIKRGIFNDAQIATKQ